MRPGDLLSALRHLRIHVGMAGRRKQEVECDKAEAVPERVSGGSDLGEIRGASQAQSQRSVRCTCRSRQLVVTVYQVDKSTETNGLYWLGDVCKVGAGAQKLHKTHDPDAPCREGG